VNLPLPLFQKARIRYRRRAAFSSLYPSSDILPSVLSFAAASFFPTSSHLRDFLQTRWNTQPSLVPPLFIMDLLRLASPRPSLRREPPPSCVGGPRFHFFCTSFIGKQSFCGWLAESESQFSLLSLFSSFSEIFYPFSRFWR